MERTLLDNAVYQLDIHGYTKDDVKYVNDFYNKDSQITWDEFAKQANKIHHDDPHINSFILMLKHDTWLERGIDGSWNKCDKLNNPLEWAFLKITEAIKDNETFKLLNED